MNICNFRCLSNQEIGIHKIIFFFNSFFVKGHAIAIRQAYKWEWEGALNSKASKIHLIASNFDK